MLKIKYVKLIICLVMATLLIYVGLQITNTVYASGTTYYVSSSGGNDNNNGTSSSTPWKTLTKASKAYVAGDQILLKCGDTWSDEQLSVSGSGTSTNPILISSYGTGNKPILRLPSRGGTLYNIKITNPSGWKITNMYIDYGETGIALIWNGDFDNDYIWIEGCDFYNSRNAIVTYVLNGNTSRTYCSNITVKDCYFQDCVAGAVIFAVNNGSFYPTYITFRA